MTALRFFDAGGIWRERFLMRVTTTDPNAPKRPKTAFFLFSDDHREEAKSKLPEGARVGEVAKELGKMWAECPDDKKAEYQEVSDANKAKYELAMQEYNMNKEQAQY